MPNPDGSLTVAEAVDAIEHSSTADPNNLPSPIGVPRGYVAQRAGEKVMKGDERLGSHYQDQQIPVVYGKGGHGYFEGDDWAPAGMPPSSIADLQKSLIAAGLIDKKASIRIGVWDDTSRKAYRDLLSYANASGMDKTEALNYIGAQGGMPDQASNRAPLQVKLTDPGELKQVFRKTVIDQLGQGWGDDRLDAMVAAYQQQERASQEQDYAQAETGGTMTQPPSAQSFAMAQAKEQDPTGVQAHDALGYQEQFFSMLKGVA